MKVQAGEKFTDQELDGLSDQERALLEGGDDETEDLKKIAGEGDADDGDDDGDEGEEAAAAAKKEADAKAAADAKAKADAEAKEKAELDRKAKEAADKAAEEAKKAGKDEAEQKAAREAAEKQAREEAAAQAEREKAEAATTTQDDDDDDEEAPPLPAYVAPKPEKYEERIAAFDKAEDEAVAQFKKGDIEIDELLKKQRDIGKERRELEAQMERHRTTAEAAEQAGQQHWRWEVSRFMRDVKKHEGIDYADSVRLNTALDKNVKELANKPENADKPGQWFLREAHKLVKTEFKLGDGDPATAKRLAEERAKREAAEKKRKEEEARREALKTRKSPLEKAPRTLGELPAAGGNDVTRDGDGEFAEANAIMESGDSLKLEAYIAGKSPEWQDRWARTQG